MCMAMQDKGLNELLPFGEYIPPERLATSPPCVLMGMDAWELERLLQRIAMPGGTRRERRARVRAITTDIPHSSSGMKASHAVQIHLRSASRAGRLATRLQHRAVPVQSWSHSPDLLIGLDSCAVHTMDSARSSASFCTHLWLRACSVHSHGSRSPLLRRAEAHGRPTPFAPASQAQASSSTANGRPQASYAHDGHPSSWPPHSSELPHRVSQAGSLLQCIFVTMCFQPKLACFEVWAHDARVLPSCT